MGMLEQSSIINLNDGGMIESTEGNNSSFEDSPQKAVKDESPPQTLIINNLKY